MHSKRKQRVEQNLRFPISGRGIERASRTDRRGNRPGQGRAAFASLLRGDDILRLQRAIGNRDVGRLLASQRSALAGQNSLDVQRMVIQRLGEQDAKKIYKDSQIQDKMSKKRQMALEKIKIMKQEQGKDWGDYIKYNNLTMEGLPKGQVSLGMFGKRVEEKKQVSTSKESMESLNVSTSEMPVIGGWSKFTSSGSTSLEEYLSPFLKERLKKRYGESSEIFQKTMAARSEDDIQNVIKIVPFEDQLVYKGDIGEVLSAAARTKAGWITITHEFDSSEHSLDVISFAPPPNLKILISEVKYWPSKMGVFTMKSLPNIYRETLQSGNAELIRNTLIQAVGSRKELQDISGEYLAALKDGMSDVEISWDIEIIGDGNAKIDREVEDYQKINDVKIFQYDNITTRLLARADSPKMVKPAKGKIGILKKREQNSEKSGVSQSDKEIKSGIIQGNLDEELLELVDFDKEQVTISLPPDITNNQQPQSVDDRFQASFAELLQMPQVDWIVELIKTMRPMVEKSHELDIDEPYYYYGRIRW